MENSFFKLRLLFQNGKFPFQNWKLSLKMENSLENCRHGKLWNPLPSFRHGNAGFKFLLSTEPRNGLGWKGPLGSPGFFLGIFWKLWFFFFFPCFWILRLESPAWKMEPGFADNIWEELWIRFPKTAFPPHFPSLSHSIPIPVSFSFLFIFFFPLLS